MKRTPFKRVRPLLRRTPLRPRSRKMQRLYREERVPLVKRLLEERSICQRCQSARPVTVHELVTRARGGSITDEDNCVALCRDCHGWIHEHPVQATGEGWLRRR